MKKMCFLLYFILLASNCFALSLNDNGYVWQKASYQERVSLCKDISRQFGDNDWQYYYDAFMSFYMTTESGILNQSIRGMAGMFRSAR